MTFFRQMEPRHLPLALERSIPFVVVPRRHFVANVTWVDAKLGIAFDLRAITFPGTETRHRPRIESASTVHGSHFVEEVRLLGVRESEQFDVLGNGLLRRRQFSRTTWDQLIDRVGIRTAPFAHMLMTTMRIVSAAASPSCFTIGVRAWVVDRFACHFRNSFITRTRTRHPSASSIFCGSTA